MRVGKIRNRYARRFAIVALAAIWVFTMLGCAVGMIIAEACFGVLLAVETFSREWNRDIENFKANIGRTW